MHNRRAVSVGLMGSALTLGGCAADGPVPVPADVVATDPAPSILKPTQCLIGLPDARRTTLLAISLHCDATRAYMRENGPRLRTGLRDGSERILLTHLARTENEVPVAVEMLSVAEDQYAIAMLAALSLSVRIDAPLSLEHVRFLISERNFRRNATETDEDRHLSVYGTRRLFTEVEGVTETPFIKDLTT